MPPGGAKKSGSGAVVAIILVVAVVAVGGILLWRGDIGGSSGGEGGASNTGGTPEQAISDFFDASNAGDCAGFVNMITASSWAQIAPPGEDGPAPATAQEAIANCEALIANGEEMLAAGVTISNVEAISNDGTTAEVEVTGTADGAPDETNIVTVRFEDGAWKIDLTAMVSEEGVSVDVPTPEGS